MHKNHISEDVVSLQHAAIRKEFVASFHIILTYVVHIKNVRKMQYLTRNDTYIIIESQTVRW